MNFTSRNWFRFSSGNGIVLERLRVLLWRRLPNCSVSKHRLSVPSEVEAPPPRPETFICLQGALFFRRQIRQKQTAPDASGRRRTSRRTQVPAELRRILSGNVRAGSAVQLWPRGVAEIRRKTYTDPGVEYRASLAYTSIPINDLRAHAMTLSF